MKPGEHRRFQPGGGPQEHIPGRDAAHAQTWGQDWAGFMHGQGLWGILGGREAGSRGKASKGPEQDPGVHVQSSGKRLEGFMGAGT